MGDTTRANVHAARQELFGSLCAGLATQSHGPGRAMAQNVRPSAAGAAAPAAHYGCEVP